MKKNPRTSEQVVNRFLNGKQPIQGVTLSDVARRLRLGTRGGSMREMEFLLRKAIDGNRLFEYVEGGQTFYEPLEARRIRFELPKWASKSKVINGIPLEMAAA